MATFFITKPPPAPYCKEQPPSDISTSWAISTINKAALKLSDIKLKLELAKVVRYLEKIDQKRKPHFVTFCQSPQFNSQAELMQYADDNFSSERSKVQKSLLNVNLSQSHFSKELSDQNMSKIVCESRFFNEESFFMPNKQNQKQQPARPMNNLKWRTVVTRNVLDQLDDHNRIVQLSKDKESSKLINTSIDQCAEENKILKKCLRQITAKLIDSFKLDIAYPHEKMRARELENYCKQLCQSDLGALQASNEMEEVNNNLKESYETCELLRQDLCAKDDEVRKYEMLIYIKDEEIASLRAIQSDLENRLSSQKEKQPQSARKQYRKFFQQVQQTGSNLSSTVS